MSSNRELLKAGKIPPRVVSSIADEFPWEPIVRGSVYESERAALACGQQVVDGKELRGGLLERLDQLGLLEGELYRRDRDRAEYRRLRKTLG